MPTIADVNDSLQRTGMIAFFYYPEVHADDPTYDVSSDVAWCMEPLGELNDEDATVVSAAITRAIVDPTAARQSLFVALVDLAPAESGQKR